MRCHVRLIVAFAIGAMLSGWHFIQLNAAERTASKGQPAQSVELFEAMRQGDIDVRFVAHSDREAQLIVKNKTKQPLSVKLPEAFAAMPVLAQNNNNRGNNNNNNQNQSGGGGFGGGGGGFGGGGGGFGGGFNIAPEGVGKLKVPVVCLEHGKADPNVRIAYEIKPIDSYSENAQLEEVLVMFGQGKLDPRATQAAVWHVANDMSWSDLAAKKINRLGRPDEPYFSGAELQLAARIATEAKNLAKARPAAEKKDRSSKEESSQSDSLSAAAAN